MGPDVMEVLGMLFLIILVMGAVICVVGIVLYIFESIGIMAMAKAKKEKDTWLAWIPYARKYLIGKVAYNTNAGGIAYLCVGIGVGLISSMISFFSGMISGFSSGEILVLFAGFVSVILTIGYQVYYYIVMYKIFKQFSKNSVLMLVFSVLTGGILAKIFIFAIRNNQMQINNTSNITQ